MSRLNLTAVVDDLTSRVDQGLGKVESGMVDLGETERDVAASCQRCLLFQRSRLTSGYHEQRGEYDGTPQSP